MFTTQGENREDSEIIALVELDMQKMRVEIAFSREAIRERLRELGTCLSNDHRVFHEVRHGSD